MNECLYTLHSIRHEIYPPRVQEVYPALLVSQDRLLENMHKLPQLAPMAYLELVLMMGWNRAIIVGLAGMIKIATFDARVQ